MAAVGSAARWFAIVSIALLTGLGGCVTQPSRPGPSAPGVDPSDVIAEGANIETTAMGSVILRWEGTIQGGKSFEVTIPPEAVAMRAKYAVGGPGERALSVVEDKTGAVRCFSTQSLAEIDRQADEFTCTGVTILDTESIHPAIYRVSILGEYRQNSADVETQVASPAPFSLLVELLPGPLDGPIGALELSALPRIQYGLAPQKTDHVVASSDGARLFVEVNLPDGPGPWPTILISSPYNQAVRDDGGLTQGVRVRDWVPRGYAVVSADVRGFANSEGCVEVWGPKEQQDQYDLVEWVAQQPWSNGKVAMYGQSYVGTTPHEAAIKHPAHLAAIATVAGLTDPYFDWHYGGVPNSESAGSPVGYSLTTDQPPAAPESPEYAPDWVGLARTQGCDVAPMLAAANQPNAVYGPFYKERNFTALAATIDVPVLYTQGYIDTNVKVAQAIRFFNAIPKEKIGVFGPWLHRHPPRGDFDVLLHAWMARWLMDAPTRVESFPTQVITNLDTVRDVTMWPPVDPMQTRSYLDATANALEDAPTGPGAARFAVGGGALGAAPGVVAANMPPGVDPVDTPSTNRVAFQASAVTERVYISGAGRVVLPLTLDGVENAHIEARLYDVSPHGVRLPVSFGMLNLGLRHSYERYEAMPTAREETVVVTLLPTEFVVDAGHRLVLELGPAAAATSATAPGEVSIRTGGPDGARLELPILADPGDTLAPTSVLGFEAFRTR